MKRRLTFNNLAYLIKEPYRNVRDWILAKRYPWLVPYTGWEEDREVYDYSVAKYLITTPDEMGWNKTIFYPMMEEIRRVARKAGLLGSLHASDYKSKYGGLRFYLSGYNDDISTIIHTYETLTEGMCELCGKPDVGYVDGWITPICERCYRKHWNDTRPYNKVIKGSGRMSDWYEYIKFDENKESKHFRTDIRPTANKLRRRWNLRHPFRKTSYS